MLGQHNDVGSVSSHKRFRRVASRVRLRTSISARAAENLTRACTRGTQVSSYDHTKHLLLSSGVLREGTACHLTASMTAGLITALVTAPVDLVKTRWVVLYTSGSRLPYLLLGANTVCKTSGFSSLGRIVSCFFFEVVVPVSPRPSFGETDGPQQTLGCFVALFTRSVTYPFLLGLVVPG